MIRKKKEPVRLFLCKNCWHRKRKKKNGALCSSCGVVSGGRRILNAIFAPLFWLMQEKYGTRDLAGFNQTSLAVFQCIWQTENRF